MTITFFVFKKTMVRNNHSQLTEMNIYKCVFDLKWYLETVDVIRDVKG